MRVVVHRRPRNGQAGSHPDVPPSQIGVCLPSVAARRGFQEMPTSAGLSFCVRELCFGSVKKNVLPLPTSEVSQTLPP